MKSYLILKAHCKGVYFFGAGNFWYEEGVIRDDKNIMYKAFQFILFSTYIFMTILEVMAAVIGDFPKDEKGDSVTFAVSHTIVMIKIASVMSKKDLIKSLNERIVKVCEKHETDKVMIEKYRIMKINGIAYSAAVYGAVFFYIFEGLRKMYAGAGNFWYEEGVVGDDTSLMYKSYQFVLFSLYIFMTVLEVMAATIADFPKDEKSDSVTFAVSHTIVMIKIASVVFNKYLIKSLNRRIVKICEKYEDAKLMRERYRILKTNITAYFVTVYTCMFFYIVEGLRKMYAGSHFVTIVTYYPSFGDDSPCATFFRVFFTVVLGILMLTMMMSVDFFTMIYLIMFKYKIITLRNYLENIRKDFDRESEINLKLASDNLTAGLIEGIGMHAELLRMCKDIDKAFGTVMALQVCQSFGSAVSLLLQIALSKDLTVGSSMKIILFVIGLFFLLGLFLCNAGEITYQASLLSDAIFYCGWHASAPQRRRLRPLVLQAVAQAQRPLVMKAFKMLELTYATFLMVVRSTYSVFALFYAQNK